jgi:hypothetical protein
MYAMAPSRHIFQHREKNIIFSHEVIINDSSLALLAACVQYHSTWKISSFSHEVHRTMSNPIQQRVTVLYLHAKFVQA